MRGSTYLLKKIFLIELITSKQRLKSARQRGEDLNESGRTPQQIKILFNALNHLHKETHGFWQ